MCVAHIRSAYIFRPRDQKYSLMHPLLFQQDALRLLYILGRIVDHLH